MTDAKTGAKLFEWQAIETGVGNTMYSGQVTLGTAPSYTLTDTGRGGHKTYNLNGGTSGTGTLFSNTTDTWGNGLPANKETMRRRRALRCRAHLGLLQERARPHRHPR